MRKVFLEAKVKLVIDIDENVEVSQVMDNLEFDFYSGEGFDVDDTEILGYEITDSK